MKQSNICPNCEGSGYMLDVNMNGTLEDLPMAVTCKVCHGTGRIEHNTKDSEANTDSSSLPQSNPDTLDEILTELLHHYDPRDHGADYAEAEAKAAILAWAESLVPEKKPRVTKRKGYYPPYQPQVEQHKRAGWNEAITQIQENIKRYSNG